MTTTRTAELLLALANIQSTPRLGIKREKAAVDALFAFAERIGADIVCGNEIDHRSLRRIWKRAAAGYTRTVGARGGSENVASVRGAWRVTGAVVRWLSTGVSRITPTRTVLTVDLEGPDGLRVRLFVTHLVSRWQAYARVKAGSTWSLRAAIGRASVARLRRRVNRARRRGLLPVVLGDVNAIDDLQIAGGQVQLLGTPGAGGNLGKMLQAAAFPPRGMTVEAAQRWRQEPTATDHPYRAVRVRVTW